MPAKCKTCGETPVYCGWCHDLKCKCNKDQHGIGKCPVQNN